MKKIFTLLLTVCMAVTANAQVINGDLNHNCFLDVEDVTLLIDGYLSNEIEFIETHSNYYNVDNSLIAGTWLADGDDIGITFNEDGTFGGILGKVGYTYKFEPFEGLLLEYHLLMYNESGALIEEFKVLELTKETMTLKRPNGDIEIYTRGTPSTIYVSSIKLSETSLMMEPNTSVQLTATVYPAYADDKNVRWSSSDEGVAYVYQDGTVYANSDGIATITCEAEDGSGVKASCGVTVKSLSGTENGHAWIDLGLSVRWATMNVGASTPMKRGKYYAWGEVSSKSICSWSSYTWGNADNNELKKYNTSSTYGTVDNKTELDLADDAAYKNWGGAWRMPTVTEWQELMAKCTWTWELVDEDEEEYGYRVTSKVNGNSIILPCAGARVESVMGGISGGFYWSNSLYVPEPKSAHCLLFSGSNIYLNKEDRCYGFSVRAVCP